MNALDLSRLSGPDAVVALRSYPRRFRTAVLPVDDPQLEDKAARVGPDGYSALDHVVRTAHTLVLLGEALRRALVEDGAVLHPAVLDVAQRQWDPPPGLTVPDALDQLRHEAEALADVASRIHGDSWNRTAAVAGGRQVTVADLVKEAVRAGAEGLDATVATLAAVAD